MAFRARFARDLCGEYLFTQPLRHFNLTRL